ncbi:hypothetical protein [Virgibacillus halodenitrificans]|uniref:hypothetical protein n=1 Tax=Virgibacillus halodenitrificans TaxID=1482 RepID=UPI000EF44066|nr:hypothetical protein [Virgibacillus halodenitrificans]MCJ0931074.1 hypothetical protein [Virgibacillus halodenitrificans]
MERSTQQPLRILLPELYQYIIEYLEEQHNIHSYDIQVFVMNQHDGYQLSFAFGEDYSHQEKITLTLKQIQNKEDNIKPFIKEFGEKCKETMIADYYKMMKM